MQSAAYCLILAAMYRNCLMWPSLSPILAFIISMISVPATAQSLSIELRSKTETSPASGRFHTEWRNAEWKADQTAIILCDMWDAHHSVTAVRRLAEFAPRVNGVIEELRSQGATIIHAPSDCMDAYRDHPARLQAISTPTASDALPDIAAWCHRIPSEESARYPIDQSDGGEDEDEWENAQWAKQLEAQGRNPGTPWKKQTAMIDIANSDFIASEGDVVWNVLRSRGVKHVILAGVHTNMCVLGRPFGLRQMVRAGIDTALLRDCTDVMYNPKRWPYVSHFTGLDLVIDHIEAYVCPTLTSDQFIGGSPFQFKQDRRPRLLMVIAEEEYETARTLPAFARDFLGNDFSVQYAFASATDRHDIRGLQQAKNADMLLVSARRRALRSEDKEVLANFIASGKPVIGIRTASHAFAPNDTFPEGHVTWPEFDAQVFGGNYHGHHGNKGPDAPVSFVQVEQGEGNRHPILFDLKEDLKWKTTSWLYKTSPLVPGTKVLMRGEVAGREPSEPLAWTFTRADGGKSFYTSLGHPDDFEFEEFRRLLGNALYWGAGLTPPRNLAAEPVLRYAQSPDRWRQTTIADARLNSENSLHSSMAWLRTLVRAPHALPDEEITLSFEGDSLQNVAVFLNGHRLKSGDSNDGVYSFDLTKSLWQAQQLNLITIRYEHPLSRPNRDPIVPDNSATGPVEDPRVFLATPPSLTSGDQTVPLDGLWQGNSSDSDYPESFENFPIPPQFGAPTDLIHNWPFE
ncbi:MAG: nicotinamidase-related amidase/type 1 glutamine amidotransferase [Verrucomicrobiales bacterium]